ncbi:hypothetical protein DE146DRAFT_608191 [Phaeosphaeria sp. MPI-PUGE-AT-0046c]|nr:hypothetical protein DE146DRAFT_608191 [Phaeosphaeria sp. MPI-PUGE-AT-0046c]
MGDCQLPPSDREHFTQLLDQVCGERQTIYKSGNVPQAPIKFKDAVGRKFSFPWELCKTWKGMEELIEQAFLHVDIIGPHVHQGHYDIVGPDGELILPQIWDTVIQPDWSVTMHMWPIPEPEPAPLFSPPPARDHLMLKRLNNTRKNIRDETKTTTENAGRAHIVSIPEPPRPPTPSPPCVEMTPVPETTRRIKPKKQFRSVGLSPWERNTTIGQLPHLAPPPLPSAQPDIGEVETL